MPSVAEPERCRARAVRAGRGGGGRGARGGVGGEQGRGSLQDEARLASFGMGAHVVSQPKPGRAQAHAPGPAALFLVDILDEEGDADAREGLDRAAQPGRHLPAVRVHGPDLRRPRRPLVEARVATPDGVRPSRSDGSEGHAAHGRLVSSVARRTVVSTCRGCSMTALPPVASARRCPTPFHHHGRPHRPHPQGACPVRAGRRAARTGHAPYAASDRALRAVARSRGGAQPTVRFCATVFPAKAFTPNRPLG